MAPCFFQSPRAGGRGLEAPTPLRGAVPLGLPAAPRPRRPRRSLPAPPRCSLRGRNGPGRRVSPPADPDPTAAPASLPGPTCVLVVHFPPLPLRLVRAPRRPAALAPPRSARPPPPPPRRLRRPRGLLLCRLLLLLPLSGPALQPLQQRARPAVRLGLCPGRLGARVPRDVEERHAGRPHVSRRDAP